MSAKGFNERKWAKVWESDWVRGESSIACCSAAAAELRTCCLCCCLTSGVWANVASGLSEELLVSKVKKIGYLAQGYLFVIFLSFSGQLKIRNFNWNNWKFTILGCAQLPVGCVSSALSNSNKYLTTLKQLNEKFQNITKKNFVIT